MDVVFVHEVMRPDGAVYTGSLTNVAVSPPADFSTVYACGREGDGDLELFIFNLGDICTGAVTRGASVEGCSTAITMRASMTLGEAIASGSPTVGGDGGSPASFYGLAAFSKEGWHDGTTYQIISGILGGAPSYIKSIGMATT